MVTDFKSAYEHEKKLRKEAEKLVEDKSREISQANEKANIQFQQMSSEFQKNALLLKIFRYSLESLKLSDLLPSIINSMLTMAHLPLGVFDYFPLDRTRDGFRSKIYVNDIVVNSGKNIGVFNDDLINDVLESISVEVIFNREKYYLSDLNEKVDSKALESFERFEIGGILALPVVADNHTSSIIYLFLDNKEKDIKNLVDLFEFSIKQLGVLIEHRYGSEKLESNYYQLKNMVDELGMVQKQLVQAEKMVSVGQLSAGIAHEINNPMGYVKSNVSSLSEYNDIFSEGLLMSKRLLSLSGVDEIQSLTKQLSIFWKNNDVEYLIDDSKSLLSETTHGVDRVLDIVSGLKSFARASDQKWAVCNVNECLDEALKLSHNELKYTCEIKKSFDDVSDVNGNAGELVQVFLNLLINASHAISEEGEITITTRPVKKGVEIKVSDNGCGIDEETLSKIFDPFYTTKDVGEGTGLGLSISFGIIENHNGRIDVKSKKGEGSSFSVWLPAFEQ